MDELMNRQVVCFNGDGRACKASLSLFKVRRVRSLVTRPVRSFVTRPVRSLVIRRVRSLVTRPVRSLVTRPVRSFVTRPVLIQFIPLLRTKFDEIHVKLTNNRRKILKK